MSILVLFPVLPMPTFGLYAARSTIIKCVPDAHLRGKVIDLEAVESLEERAGSVLDLMNLPRAPILFVSMPIAPGLGGIVSSHHPVLMEAERLPCMGVVNPENVGLSFVGGHFG